MRSALPERSLFHWSALFIIVGSPILLLLWINRFGVDLPFYDEWIFMGEFLREGFLRSLFNPHNDHRIVTTRIVFFILKKLTAWNRWPFFYLNFATACFTFLLIAFTVLKKRFTPRKLWVIALCAMLIFSAGQLENWTWGFQIQWFHNAALSLLTLLFLNSRTVSIKTIIAAACLGIATSLTIAGGLFIWPVGIATLTAARLQNRAKIFHGLIWLVVGAITWTLYQHGLPDKHILDAAIENPGLASISFLAVIGAPIVNFRSDGACIFGAIGFALYAILAAWMKYILLARNNSAKNSLDASILWMSWGAFCLLSMLAIALARFPNGGVQYVLEASRYTSVSALFWVSLILAVHSFFIEIDRPLTKSLEKPLLVLVGIASCLFLFTTENSLKLWEHRHSIMTQARNIVLSYDPYLLPGFDESRAAAQNIGFVNSDTAALLNAAKLSPFEYMRRNPVQHLLPSKPNSTSGFIDEIKTLQSQNDKTAVRVTGWATDPSNPLTAASLVILMKGEEVIATVPCWMERKDVVEAKGLPADTRTGWEFVTTRTDINKENIKAYALSNDGEHTIQLNSVR